MFENNKDISKQKERAVEIERVEHAVLSEIDELVRERHHDKEYHAPEHSKTVDKNSAEIFAIVEENNPGTITEEMERARKTGARGHDIYIATAIDPKTGKMFRLRGLGPDNMPQNVAGILKAQGKPLLGNEEASAVEVVGVVTRNDPDQRVYTGKMNDMMIENIRATYPIPSFTAFSEATYTTTEKGENRIVIKNPDTGEITDVTEYFSMVNGKPVGLKMDQFINEDSRLGAVATAIGDLSQGGRFGSENFKDEGNREFWESKPELAAMVHDGVAELGAEEKALLAKEALDWITTQMGFLLHQKMRFEHILESSHAVNSLPQADATKTALRARYSEWDRNILACAERVRTTKEQFSSLTETSIYMNPASNAELEELLQEMSYGAVGRG